MKFLNTVILMQIALLVLMSCNQKKKGFSSEDIQGRWAIDMEFENHSLDRVIENSSHDVYPPRNLFGVFSNGFYSMGILVFISLFFLIGRIQIMEYRC